MKILCIGEAIVDNQVLDDKLIPHVGGAPLNVSVALKLMNVDVNFVTMLGDDYFKDFILKELNSLKLDTKYIFTTNKGNTSLAFVSNDETGNRRFSFYRTNPSDKYLTKNYIKEEMLEDIKIIHFGSLALLNKETLKSHLKLLKLGIKKNILISFDPNLRFNLVNNLNKYQKLIIKLLKYTNILKISDDELEFITKKNNEKEAIEYLKSFKNIKIIMLTKGKKGASIYYKNEIINASTNSDIKAIDTTGAGDLFTAIMLKNLINEDIKNVSIKRLNEYLKEAVTLSSKSTLYNGAIASYKKVV